jgi:hypothetical protein
VTKQYGTALVAINILLSWVMLWFAIRLAMPADTFDTNPGYVLFQSLCPSELVWAVAFFVAFLFGVISLVATNVWVRILSACALSTAHAMVALLFVLSGSNGTASGTYAGIAALGYYLVYRRLHEPA